MKANELVVGKKYWCGWASRSAWFVRFETQYDNPMRSQILQNGEEFRDAAPELRPILEKKPKPGNIKYEYLDDAAKAVLDGTVTIDNYKQQEATTETKQDLKTGNNTPSHECLPLACTDQNDCYYF